MNEEPRIYTLNKDEFVITEKYLLAMILALTVVLSETSGGVKVYGLIEQLTADIHKEIQEGRPSGTEESTGESGQPAG